MNTNTTQTITVLVERTVGAEGLTVSFANGESITVKADALSADIQCEAMLHGLKQKLMDAAAMSRDTTTGRSATVEDKYQAVKAVADRLLRGEWNKGRGEGTSPTGGLLLRALMVMYPEKTSEQLTAFLSGKTKDELAALRKNPKVMATMAMLRAPTPSGVDTDALLGELGA